MIISHLDIVTQMCLQITCRFFRALVIVDRVALEHDRCRKWAITCFLEHDMDPRYSAKVACAYCKTVRPIRHFRAFNHGVGIWQSLRYPSVLRDRGMMTGFAIDRYCRLPRKCIFTRDYTFRTSKGTRIPKPRNRPPGLISLRAIRCWHCVWVIRFDDKREAGCLNCLFDFCPRLPSRQFFRIGPCLPGQGLFIWNGPGDVIKDESCDKKRTRLLVIHEVGGQIVPAQRLPGGEPFYV